MSLLGQAPQTPCHLAIVFPEELSRLEVEDSITAESARGGGHFLTRESILWPPHVEGRSFHVHVTLAHTFSYYSCIVPDSYTWLFLCPHNCRRSIATMHIAHARSAATIRGWLLLRSSLAACTPQVENQIHPHTAHSLL